MHMAILFAVHVTHTLCIEWLASCHSYDSATISAAISWSEQGVPSPPTTRPKLGTEKPRNKMLWMSPYLPAAPGPLRAILPLHQRHLRLWPQMEAQSHPAHLPCTQDRLSSLGEVPASFCFVRHLSNARRHLPHAALMLLQQRFQGVKFRQQCCIPY